MFDLIDMLIVRPIVNIFFAIYSLVGDFGIAIIIFVVLVKILMWPMMKRQLHQTRIMKEIQPELAEIKKRCKGNRQMESLQMMDLYKRKNVKPFRSMLTILIQLPLFISLFTAINVATRPRDNYNVEHSAYSFVRPLRNVDELITKQSKYLEDVKYYTENKDNEEKKDELTVPVYEFEPKLFGLVDLSATAGFSTISSVIILVFALASAATQYIMARQQDPTRKKGKKSIRSLMKDAAKGKEASQEEINAAAQGQMTLMMPFMMLLIMISLPGALVFYYLLNNIITVVIQKIILNRNYTEMEAAADKKILKELKDAQEAVVVEDNTTDKKATHYASSKNKQEEKLHITRISASNKKKRR
ncbi:YidC/Oxa1 family membrane protein insertase [Candidatus Saccharibacteria bacterium]|nr:YidC/Oxa1 family membrane protein insertase [Candidatus Saccharibacteria bacterium]